MSWKDIIKNEDFDWDKEMKNIFDRLGELHTMLQRSTSMNITAGQIREEYDSITNSLHELEYFYERNKEKLQ
jgi:hypothetical protein